MKRFIICIAALMLLGTNVYAAVDFIEPYGFSVPLSDVSENPSDELPASFTNLVGVDVVHKMQYDPAASTLKIIGDRGNMSWLYAGAKDRLGQSFLQPNSLGKVKNSVTFKFNVSEKKKNGGSCYEIEKFDICQQATVNGEKKDYMLYHGYMTYAENGWWATNYEANFGGSKYNLLYDTFYTFTSEADVRADTLNFCLTAEDGTVVLQKTYSDIGLENVYGGIRIRFSDFLDVEIKEMSCWRDTFAITEPLRISEEDGKITASVSLAQDAGNAHGEPASASPLLLIGQYAADNRLISYSKQSVPTEYRGEASTGLDIKNLSVTVDKHRDFDHAAAYLWTNENDCLAYCDTVELDG